MAYGLYVESDNGEVQFDSTLQESFAVISSGTLAHGATLSSINFDNDIIATNRSTTGYVTCIATIASSTWQNVSGVTINYIRYRRVTQETPDESDTYGLEIYNNSGTVTFSSNMSKAPEIVKIQEANTIGSLSDNTTRVLLYTGDPTGMYVAMGAPWSGGAPSYVFDQSYYDYTANKIEYKNYLAFNTGSGDTYVGYNNNSSIIIFKQKG